MKLQKYYCVLLQMQLQLAIGFYLLYLLPVCLAIAIYCSSCNFLTTIYCGCLKAVQWIIMAESNTRTLLGLVIKMSSTIATQLGKGQLQSCIRVCLWNQYTQQLCTTVAGSEVLDHKQVGIAHMYDYCNFICSYIYSQAIISVLIVSSHFPYQF